jgi:hypothetical protein
MPITRSGMRQQVIQNLAAVAPPGEQFIACIHAETGPSPYLLMLFDEIPFLVPIVEIMRKRYYITMTNSSFIVNKATRMRNAVKEIVCVVPVGAAPLQNVKIGWWMWNKAYFQFPGDPKQTKIYFHRIWKSDVNRMLEVLQQMGIGQAPAGYGQVPNQLPGQQQYPPQQQGYPQQQGQYQAPPQPYGQPQQPYPPQQQGYAPPQSGQYQQPQQPQSGPYYQ